MKRSGHCAGLFVFYFYFSELEGINRQLVGGGLVVWFVGFEGGFGSGGVDTSIPVAALQCLRFSPKDAISCGGNPP